MTRRSLRHEEAQARAAAVRVTSMHLELDLTEPNLPTFGSRTTIRFSATADETFVDFAGQDLVGATLNGQPVDRGAWQTGRIALTGLQPDNTLVVEGRMAYSTDGEGLHRHVDPADGRTYLYAMSFLDVGPRWFACFDQPDLKAPYEVVVTAPADWTVLGNGPSTPERPGQWRIRTDQPLATYFITLVAGPYVSVTDEHDGIPLGLHAKASLARELEAQAPDMLAVTKASFDYYHRLFGRRYPYGDYHQAFVPDFNAGAMENPGCVTFRDSFLHRGRETEADRGKRAGVIAHEMAHQWFGDLVTLRWWDDLWLNESFAEYLAHRCCAAVTDYLLWTEFGVLRKDWGAVADQSPSTHPVAGNGAPDAETALQNFDGISYAKGAAVLKQLAVHLGDEVFLGGLRDYVDRFAHGNAAFGDLMAAWTRAGAVDLDRWAAGWLRTSGMDTLDVAGSPPTCAVTSSGTLRPHTVRVGVVDPAGALTEVATVTVADAPAPVDLPADTALVLPDAADETWAKIRFGPDGWGRVAAVLPLLADGTAAVVVYNAVRDAVRDADLDPELALAIIGDALPRHSSDVTATTLLGFAVDELAGSYCPAAERPGRLAAVHEIAGRMLAAAPPGSDRQTELFPATVRSCTDVDLLRDWRAGRRLPDGLVVDVELTWVLVGRLAALLPEPDLVEEALAADPSASGRVHAARARAALPLPGTKAAAWAVLTTPTDTVASELYATGAGFWPPSQTELTAPYVERYFVEIGGTARFRSGWALGQAAVSAFPRTAATPEAVALAEQALAGDLAAPVRRAVVDGTDHLRRAVASLARYAG